MFVYAVMKCVPYEGSYPVKHFANEDDAKYYADWCNAIEHDTILKSAEKYKQGADWIKHTLRDDYEVEEFEVIK